ncbi:hypothetical protein GCM10010250_03900 [Streptomyces althioticus]|nr:hypothetical protein GCM10010250_03900 [Streptomyces althioticus]
MFGAVARWTGAASGAGTARGRTGTSVTPGVPALRTAGVSGAAGEVARGAAPGAGVRGGAVSGVLVRWTAGVRDAGGVVVRGGVVVEGAGVAVEGAGAGAPPRRTGAAADAGGMAPRGEVVVEVAGAVTGALVRWTAGVAGATGTATARGGVAVEAAGPDVLVR